MKMKLLLMLLAIALVAGTAQANMLVNPGFEDGAFADKNIPDGWYLSYTSYTSAWTWFDDADGAHWGSKYIRMNIYSYGSTAWLEQTVDVTEDQEYAFSVWAKSVTESMPVEVWAWVDWTEPNTLSEGGYDIISGDWVGYSGLVGNDWEHADFGTLTAPEAATQAIYWLAGVPENLLGILFDDAYMGIPLPSSPSPIWEGFVHPGDVDLSWTNLAPIEPATSVYVDVLFGSEPNETHPAYDMAYLTLDPVSGQDVTSVTVNVPDLKTYYWQVKSYLDGNPADVDYDTSDPNDPNSIKGNAWSFTTANDLKPSIDAGGDVITWSGQSVPLNSTIDDDGTSPLTYLWTAIPTYGVTFDPDEYAENPTVTITLPPGYIGIINAGFEIPVLPDGESVGTIGTTIDGWIQGYYGLTSGTWYSWSDDYCGVVNPDSKYGYEGEAPEGENIAYVTADGNYRMGLCQDLPVTLQPNTTYNVSVLVGKPKPTPTDYAIELIAGHACVGLVEGAAPLDDWLPVSMTVTTGSDAISDPNLAHVGQPLEIRLLTTGGNVVNFDDLLMTADPPVSSAATVTMILKATDAVGPDFDRMTIDVYDGACAAAVGAGLSADNPGDIVLNCITEIEDLSEMLLTWLDDKTIEAHHRPAADIYFDDFSGDGLSGLDGTAPDIRPGTETWISADGWANDGTNSTSWASAILPFVPSGDNVYQLSATLDVTEGDEEWFALGFAQDNNFRNWVDSTNPVGWILNRETGASVSSLGPKEEGQVDHATTNEPYDFMMELDTNPALWTVEWFAAPEGQPLVSIRGPVEFTTNPTITHVGFGASGPNGGAGAARGSVDNFMLHEGPIPGGDPVDAGSSWATSTGESITVDDAVAPEGTYLWTADPDTDVEITGSTTLTPTVTYNGSTTDNPTAIELTLDVDSGSASDTMKIYVYDDSCRAAIGAGADLDPADFDADCQTRLEDFAEMAEAWLVDYTLTEPIEKP